MTSQIRDLTRVSGSLDTVAAARRHQSQSQGSSRRSTTTPATDRIDRRRSNHLPPASDISSSKSGSTGIVAGARDSTSIRTVPNTITARDILLEADVQDYDDDDANAYPEPNDTQDSTSNPEFLGGQNTYKSAENEICDHFSRQAEVRRSNTALQQPSQTTTGAVNMVAPRITIVNDKDSMKQIIRVFVKKHLFRKLKFWKKADDGGYSSDPKTPAGLFFRTIQIPTLMNAEDKATLWASYVPLVGQLHTDHRNNCIKAMQKQYKGNVKSDLLVGMYAFLLTSILTYDFLATSAHSWCCEQQE